MMKVGIMTNKSKSGGTAGVVSESTPADPTAVAPESGPGSSESILGASQTIPETRPPQQSEVEDLPASAEVAVPSLDGMEMLLARRLDSIDEAVSVLALRVQAWDELGQRLGQTMEILAEAAKDMSITDILRALPQLMRMAASQK